MILGKDLQFGKNINVAYYIAHKKKVYFGSAYAVTKSFTLNVV